MEDEFQARQELQYQQLSKGIKNPYILVALDGNNTGLGWKFLGGTLFALGVLYVFAAISITILALFSGIDIQPEAKDSLMGIDKNALLFASMVPFAMAFFSLVFILRSTHRRKFISVITPLKQINWKKILIAFFLYFMLSFVSEGIFYALNPDNYILQFNLSRFLPLLLITCVLMPLQTSFEEVLFRGYLLQAFGIWFKNGALAVIVTSVLFALMHSWNPEVDKFGFWVMFPYYFGFGLFLGFITIKDKSLEIGLGVHAANNMFSSLFLTFQGSALETDAVFMQKTVDPAAMMPLQFAFMFVFLLICTFLFGWWRRGAKTIEA